MEVEIGVAAIEGGAVVSLGDRRFVPDERRHGRGEAGLGGAHQTVRSRRRIFQEREHAQRIALRKREPFGLGDIRFGLRQHGAEKLAG